MPAVSNDAKPVVFSSDVAPILMRHCVDCHRPGEIAPMSLLTYREARPWARSIQRMVVNREMPPWLANPEHGTWANDARLSQEEIDTIVAWVEGGAERGDLSRMPEAPVFTEGWQLGEPDHVIDLPAVTVPAAHFDNSSENPANPDPNQEVTWGLDAADEMMFGVFELIEVGPETAASTATARSSTNVAEKTRHLFPARQRSLTAANAASLRGPEHGSLR